jgi:uncharacterized membrane protein
MRRKIQILAWCLIVQGCIILIYFAIKTFFDGYWICGTTDFSLTGLFGDFVGGVVGTVFALAGTLFIFLTFYEQIKQNKREAFEGTFFTMINLHRNNIDEMKYTKFDTNTGEMRTASNRKVFRLIFAEFTECYQELKRISNFTPDHNYILPKYKEYLDKIIASKMIDIHEFTLIDIAYNIIFFGVGEEGETELQQRLYKRYNSSYIDKFLLYIKLKPKKENMEIWIKWKIFSEIQDVEFEKIYREFCDYNNNIISERLLSKKTRELISEKKFAKYYNGHQHRLSHYFRHLYQSYRYLSFHKDLSDEEKYFYGKMFRAQLSINEQAILFINSISSLGMQWELNPDKKLETKSEKDIAKSNLITRFNLIKNLTDYHFLGFQCRTYYPDIKYERCDF